MNESRTGRWDSGADTRLAAVDAIQHGKPLLSRRHFLGRAGFGLGATALATLLARDGLSATARAGAGGLPDVPHFAPRARRVIYLCQSGAPSQLDLLSYRSVLCVLS